MRTFRFAKRGAVVITAPDLSSISGIVSLSTARAIRGNAFEEAKMKIFGNTVQAGGTSPDFSDADLEQFEARLKIKLPKDYRGFLQRYRGGDLDRDIFGFLTSSGILVDNVLQKLYPFRGEFGEESLELSHDLSKNFELDAFSGQLSNFLEIGYCVNGDPLLIDLESGRVGILMHDFIEVPGAIPIGTGAVILEVSKSFEDFVRGLMSTGHLDF